MVNEEFKINKQIIEKIERSSPSPKKRESMSY